MLAGTEAEAGEQIHAHRRVREMNLELLGRNKHGKKRMNEWALFFSLGRILSSQAGPDSAPPAPSQSSVIYTI